MAWTTKLLVVANRTVESEELHETLLARARLGPIAVTVVAPASPEPGGVLTARSVAAERVERAVGRLRADGLAADGVVGDPDPLLAVDEIWDPRRFDEIIVSTLPSGTSRWLQYDLPHRIARFTGARVTHVIGHAREPVG